MELLAFVKAIKIILTERFVLLKQNWNFKRKIDDKQLNKK